MDVLTFGTSQEDNPRLNTTLLGICMFTRGIGNILSTPISTALSHLDTARSASGSALSVPETPHPAFGFDVADGKFAKMILYVGTCFAGVAVIALVGFGMDAIRVRRRLRNT